MHEVPLPKSTDPILPAPCVGCGYAPDTTRTVRVAPLAFVAFLAPIPLPGSRTIHAPICRACRSRDRNQFLRDKLIGFPIFFAAMIGCIVLFKTILPYPFWIIPGVVVLFVVICIIALTFGDPSLTARRVDDSIVYTFRSPYAAARFARLNNARITRTDTPTFNWREQF